jgi:hypothetical protein
MYGSLVICPSQNRIIADLKNFKANVGINIHTLKPFFPHLSVIVQVVRIKAKETAATGATGRTPGEKHANYNWQIVAGSLRFNIVKCKCQRFRNHRDRPYLLQVLDNLETRI